MKNLLFKNLKYISRFSEISCEFRRIRESFALDPDSDPSLIDVDETGRKTLHENSLSTQVWLKNRYYLCEILEVYRASSCWLLNINSDNSRRYW